MFDLFMMIKAVISSMPRFAVNHIVITSSNARTQQMHLDITKITSDLAPPKLVIIREKVIALIEFDSFLSNPRPFHQQMHCAAETQYIHDLKFCHRQIG